MRFTTKWGAIVVLSAALVGCVSTPTSYQFDNSAISQQSFDETWSNVIGFFAENNIPIKTLEKDSGLVVAETGSLTDQEITILADCPGAVLTTSDANIANYNVFVRETQEGVKVQVNTKFTRTLRGSLSNATQSFTCNSKGEAEKSVLAAIL